MKYIKSLELNEAKYSKGYQKLGKLDYNDQFKSRVSNIAVSLFIDTYVQFFKTKICKLNVIIFH